MLFYSVGIPKNSSEKVEYEYYYEYIYDDEYDDKFNLTSEELKQDKGSIYLSFTQFPSLIRYL